MKLRTGQRGCFKGVACALYIVQLLFTIHTTSFISVTVLQTQLKLQFI